jgi:hypothetical protein
VAQCYWTVALHTDQQNRPLDLIKNGWTRSNLGGSPEKIEMAGDGGCGDRKSMVTVVPANSRGGEVYDGVQLLLAIMSASWSSSSASRNVGEVWMELTYSGETPARNRRRLGDL